MAHSVMFKILLMGKQEARLIYIESEEIIVSIIEILALI